MLTGSNFSVAVDFLPFLDFVITYPWPTFIIPTTHHPPLPGFALGLSHSHGRRDWALHKLMGSSFELVSKTDFLLAPNLPGEQERDSEARTDG